MTLTIFALASSRLNESDKKITLRYNKQNNANRIIIFRETFETLQRQSEVSLILFKVIACSTTV